MIFIAFLGHIVIKTLLKITDPYSYYELAEILPENGILDDTVRVSIWVDHFPFVADY